MDTNDLQIKKNRLFQAGTCRSGALCAAAGMVLWAVFAAAVLKFSFPAILTAVLFQAVCVALPGTAVLKLFRFRLTPLEALAASYALGIGTTLIVYFPFGVIHRTELIPYAEAVLVVLCVVIHILRRKRPLAVIRDGGELAVGIIICFIAAAVTSLAFSAGYLNPAIAGARSYYHDTMNAVTVLASAKIGYPFEFLQMAGVIYWYHPFLYAYGAVMSLCTGIPAFEVVTKLLTLTISPLGASIFTAIGYRMTRSTKAAAAIAAAGSLLPAGYSMYYYLYEDVLGFPLGIAFAALSVLFFLKGQESGKKLTGYHWMSVLFLALCTGAKGPVAVTVIFGLCFALLIELIRDRNWWVIPKGLSYALPFFALYFLLYGTATDESMSFSVGYSAVRLTFGRWLIGVMGEGPLSTLIACIEHALTFEPVVTLAFILSIVLAVRRKCADDYVNFTMGGTACGLVMIELFKQMGSSEYYFNMCMFQFSVILIVIWLVSMSDTKKTLFRTACVILAAFWICYGVYESKDQFLAGAKNAIRYSAYSNSRAFTDDETALIRNRGNSISTKEYEGYVFIRDNMDKYAVIADYRYSLNNKFFMGSAFSERRFFLDGWGYVTMEDGNDNTDQKTKRDLVLKTFYEQSDEDFIPLLKTYGITHIVITQYISPGWELEGRYTTTLFKNSDIAVYEIN